MTLKSLRYCCFFSLKFRKTLKGGKGGFLFMHLFSKISRKDIYSARFCLFSSGQFGFQ